ncbi:Protein of unknown function [Seinonella peptonophila]|uniref:Uncharacterized protein n=1 Tax=Seinonella peptonophila TaxID=112248 RepID=A0A1M4Y7E2_9BACL|nr:DUF981 family protein [Seinonella peptonophila]SHF01503.1 Protein of unknown function [Seinonella peptonophila]
MITYTTIMGLAAGVALILLPMLAYQLYKNRIQTFDVWALTFGGLGMILTISGGHMSLFWPLQSPEKFKNFMFGEMTCAFGVLLILAAVYLWKRGNSVLAKGDQALDHLFTVAQPVSVFVFALGLALTAITIGAIQFEVFATAPSQEPILGTWPKSLVNLSLCALYALPAIGCLVTLPAVWVRSQKLMMVACSTWFVTGIGWLLVAVVVYYTHIAMDFNFRVK